MSKASILAGSSLLAFAGILCLNAGVSASEKDTQTGLKIKEMDATAFTAYRAKDWNRAIEHWSKILVLEPEHNEALRWRENAYIRADRYDDALRDHKQLVKQNPESATSWFSLCFGQLRAHQLAEARKACETAQSIDADSMEATVSLGHTYLLEGDKVHAWQWYERGLKLIDTKNQLEGRPLQDLAVFLERNWQPELTKEAQTWFVQRGEQWLAEKAPLDDIQESATHSENGTALAKLEQAIPLALALYGKDHPRYAKVLEKLSDQYFNTERYNEALPLQRDVLSIREQQGSVKVILVSPALDKLAKTLVAMKLFSEAESLYSRASILREQALQRRADLYGSNDRRVADLARQFADQYRDNSLFDRALTLYRKAFGIYKAGGQSELAAYAQCDIADMLSKIGLLDEAATSYQHAQVMLGKILPRDHPIAIDNLLGTATVYLRISRNQDAMLLFEAALGLIVDNKENAKFRASIKDLMRLHSDFISDAAIAASKAKDWAAAITHWNRLLVLDPDNRRALYRRGIAHRNNGSINQAIVDHQRAITLDPKDSDSWGALCWEQILANTPAEARKTCERAIAFDMGETSGLLNLGHTYLLQGDRAGAWVWYAKATALISSESDLRAGLDDFSLFERRGWQIMLSKEARTMFEQQGSDVLSKSAQLTGLRAEATEARKRGELKAELDALSRRVAASAALYGTIHFKYAETLIDLAIAQEKSGAHEIAATQRAQVLPIIEKRYGIDSDHAETEARKILELYKLASDPVAKTTFLGERLSRFITTLGATNERAGFIRSELIKSLCEQKRFTEALPLGRDYLKVIEHTIGATASQKNAAEAALIPIYLGLGRNDEVIKAYKKLSKNDRWYCAQQLDFYADNNWFDAAVREFDICRGNEPRDSSLAYSAFIHRALGHVDKAIDAYLLLIALDNADRVRRKSTYYGSVHYLYILAALYDVKGLHAKAKAILSEAQRIAQAPRYGEGLQISADPAGPRSLAVPRLVANTGHSDGILGIALSSDGKRLVSAGKGGDVVKTWDIGSGMEIDSFKPVSKSIRSFAVSSDGRLVAVGSKDGMLEIWNVRDRAVLHVIKAHLVEIRNLAFSPDGSQIVSNAADGFVRLWSVAQGRELRRLPSFGDRVLFSPDGKELIEGGVRIHIWDIRKGELLASLRIPSEFDKSISSLAFDKVNNVLAVGSNNVIALWDYKKRTFIRTMPFSSYRAATAESLSFSANGQVLVSGHSWGAMRVWDVKTGKQVREIEAGVDIGGVNSLLYTGRSTMISAGEYWNEIRFWDSETGLEQRKLGGQIETIRAVAFSPDTQILASASWHINLWNMKTGASLSQLPGSDYIYAVSNLIFSPDGTKLVASGGAKIAQWEVPNSKQVWSVTASIDKNVYWTKLDLSPDARSLISRDYKVVRQWDFVTGKQRDAWTPPAAITPREAFFSSSGEPAVRDDKGLVRDPRTWDLVDRKPRAETTMWVNGAEVRVGVNPGGKDISTSAFLVNGLEVVVEGPSLVLREPGSTTWKARLLSFVDGAWAVVDPDGRYDAANAGQVTGLHWVMGDTPMALSQLKDRYYDPGLLQKILGYSKEPLRTIPKFEDALLHRWPEVDVSVNAKNPLRLNIHLTDRGDGYGRVRVRLNGKEVTANAANGKGISGKTADLAINLDPDWLLPGDNRIDVVAWPSVGHIPSPAAQIVVSGAAARGLIRSGGGKPQATEPITLHAIVMGVGQYAGPGLRLAFPGKDAIDFAQALELGGTRMFGAERVRMHRFSDYAVAGVDVSGERLPSRDNLRHAFETVATEAKAGDILLVYLAGHGVMTPGAAGEAEYYYLSREAQSTDLSDLSVRKLWGVSSTELTDWIKRIKASKQVLVLDTCAAGGAIDKLVAKRQIPGAQVIAMEQLKDRTGMHILAGAAADRVSYEATQFGQGLLTYALLTGMKGAALKDEMIDVQKLFQFTRDEVPKLARQIGGIQEPRLSAPQGESFVIGRMAEDDRRKVPLAQIRPMIQRASFQDEARMKDVIRLGQRFDDRMKMETYAAARGAMIYVDADDFPEAWQLSGRYSKDAKGVRVMARLFQGEKEMAAFEVLLPLKESEQAEVLLTATLKAMGKVLQ